MDWKRQHEHNPAEIILTWSNMWTFQNFFVMHARRIDDVYGVNNFKKLLLK